MAVLCLVCVRGRGGALSLWAKTKDFNSYTCRVPKNAGCLRKCLSTVPDGVAPAKKTGQSTRRSVRK
jgi:hypothetical protein